MWGNNKLAPWITMGDMLILAARYTLLFVNTSIVGWCLVFVDHRERCLLTAALTFRWMVPKWNYYRIIMLLTYYTSVCNVVYVFCCMMAESTGLSLYITWVPVVFYWYFVFAWHLHCLHRVSSLMGDVYNKTPSTLMDSGWRPRARTRHLTVCSKPDGKLSESLRRLLREIIAKQIPVFAQSGVFSFSSLQQLLCYILQC